MARITGIDGIFLRAHGPDALTGWYRRHPGVVPSRPGPQHQEAGPTAVSVFAEDDAYWPADRHWMLNLRTDDIDGLLAHLSAAGIEARTDPAWDAQGIGRFARIHDPEGTPIELREPPAA
ncbi:VOC family protein [Jannaschia aquimarina]|uniref:Glyoxalase-like domain protein n=1 Tax=Jannaschia aquimarina TaxID=935700 RepID=A0A0D1EES2_9RHOB|nr:VOC family protein [Jannaschia aquimarina]KIT15381.1 Glyoxalase-like domain protein [Jannaschia aquimarina]SNT23126.1 hypothetical protein SAMN05421775_108100 [Jannaschia aquimarina]